MTPAGKEPATFQFVTQHLHHSATMVPTETSTVQGVFPGGKKELVCKADNLTSILGHGHVIWEPQLPGTLWASQACNGTDLPYFYCFLMSMK